jgi:hypothetical protein
MRKKIFSLLMEILIVMGLWLLPVMIWANPAQEKEQVIYPPIAKAAPDIDGLLDDETWKIPPLKKDFFSYFPGYGEVMPEKTRVWMTYDSSNLYFAFKCFDSQPRKIKTSITRRDNMYRDDWIGLSLDAQGNKHTSYHLFINPNGIQGDALNSAVTGEDRAPDFIWESSGKITADGYQVEICIPLKSISFKSGEAVKMGILFWRYISRLGMSGSWPGIKPGDWVFQCHVPIIYKNLKNPLKLELLPAITHSRNRERLNLQQWEQEEKSTGFGIGLKYGITSAITTDITINPDFSQVESDAFQVEVNQRYPLFYDEKRPFFMEGGDMFSFFTIPDGFLPHPVHTRLIVDPIWGAKITGSVGKASVGVLAAVDKGLDKKSLFGIVRAKYNLGEDNYIGILYSGHELRGDYNRVVGADMSYRLFKNHKINTSFLQGMSENNAGEEPGANPKQAANSSDVNFMYAYTSKHLEIRAAFEHIGKDFRMDSSFLRRTGINNSWMRAEYSFYPDSKKLPWLKLIQPEIIFLYTYDLNTRMDDLSKILELGFSFTRRGYLEIDYAAVKESWQGQTFDLDQFMLFGGIQLTRWLQVEGYLVRGEKIHYEAEPSYKGNGNDASISLVFQPTYNLNQQFNFIYSDLVKDKEKIYEVNIFYSRTTYQFNKYFFLRAVIQYDSSQKRLLTDFLASFTLIPGTVVHAGYGGLYENREWQHNQWMVGQGDMINIKRSFFAKVSYLWRF